MEKEKEICLLRLLAATAAMCLLVPPVKIGKIFSPWMSEEEIQLVKGWTPLPKFWASLLNMMDGPVIIIESFNISRNKSAADLIRRLHLH